MIRVLLVDDQPLVRGGLRGILRADYGFEVVGECGDGASVLDEVLRTSPDVVVMDLRMPGVDGAEATRRLARRPGSPPVLVLTTFDDDASLSAALRAGAAGFLLKDAALEEIHQAVAAVSSGAGWLDPVVCGRVLAAYRRSSPPQADEARRLAVLTPREIEVLARIGAGETNAEIARSLAVSEATVKTHVGSVLAKLHLRDRPAAIVFAFDNGLVTPRRG